MGPTSEETKMRTAIRTGDIGHTETRSRLRQRAYQAAAILVGAFYIIGGGAIYLTTSWFLPEEHPVHGVAFGSTLVVLAGAAVLATVRRPQQAVAQAYQAVAVILTFVSIALVTGRNNPNPAIDAVSLGVPLLVLVAVHPYKRALAPVRERLDRPLCILAVALSLPLLAYAGVMAMGQLQAAPSDPMIADGVTRYAALAGAAIGVAISAVLASTRVPGWRFSAWSAGISAALLGAVSVLYPNDTGSFGSGPGLLAVAMGLMIILTAERRHRATTPVVA